MPDRPTLHLTNWSSRKLHGPGRKLTIMAAPRRWEHGAGCVHILVPNRESLRLYKAGRIDLQDYRNGCEMAWEDLANLAPGVLEYGYKGEPGCPVLDGDSLLCSCSRPEAAAGRCHRAWAAPYLVRAGWRVFLDGVEVTHG